MANPLPPKITFNSVEEDPDPDPDTLLPPAATVSTSRADPSPLFPRLVPPSEKQANHTLPPHIFVTTVDVEEGLSSNRKNQQSHEIYTNEESWLDQEIVGVDKGTKNHLGLDFGPAEKRWESFVHVTALSQLEPGGIVGWKVYIILPWHHYLIKSFISGTGY